MRPRPLELTAGRRRILAGKVAVVLALALAAPAQAGNSPHVAVDADGNANFVWLINDATDSLVQERSEDSAFMLSDTQWVSGAGRSALVQVRRRAFSSGTLSAVQDLSLTGGNGLEPQIAMTGAEEAVVVWRRSTRAGSIIQARKRRATGALTEIQELSK